MDLNTLEADSIFVIREAYNRFGKVGLLWSIGKDSTVLLHLIRKAFFGHVPFPVVHIDTSMKIPSMIEYRDKVAREYGLNLVVGQNRRALDEGMGPTRGRMACCGALKTEALIETTREHGFQALIVGIRHDEEGSRGKERVFSPRDENYAWDFRDQPPEFWDQYNTEFPENVHVRVHAILRWSELNIWQYIEREEIPVIDLYFSKNGKRYRSIGCHPCTGQIESGATTIREIIEELEKTKVSERAGRAQDKETDFAMQKLRTKGYM